MQIASQSRNSQQFKCQKIIAKHIYVNRQKQILNEYQVKYQGQSYLNTQWVNQDHLPQLLVQEYENCLKFKQIEQNNNQYDQQSQQQRDYNTTSESFRIQINTRFRRQSNHHSFGNKIIKINKQIHRFYQNNKSQYLKLKQCQEEESQSNILQECSKKSLNKVQKVSRHSTNSMLSIKNQNFQETQIALEITEQTLKDKNNLMNVVYQKYNKLKQTKYLINSQHYGKIMHIVELQVQWDDGSVSRVKSNYLETYQPKLLKEYNILRQNIRKIWAKHQEKSRFENITELCKSNKSKLQDLIKNKIASKFITIRNYQSSVIKQDCKTDDNIASLQNRQTQIITAKPARIFTKYQAYNKANQQSLNISKNKIVEQTSLSPQEQQQFFINKSILLNQIQLINQEKKYQNVKIQNGNYDVRQKKEGMAKKSSKKPLNKIELEQLQRNNKIVQIIQID